MYCVASLSFDAKNNLPMIISFVGKLYNEGTLLRIAKFYQDHTGHDEVHPEAFR